MKKNSFTFPFKSNFFKEQDPFHLVIVFFIIFFGTAIFFSIPTFYDYKKYNQQIKRTIYNQFKLNIENIEDISFKFIPSPHLLIRSLDLKIKDNEVDSIGKLENVKFFISLVELYKSGKFDIKRVVIKKSNLYLNNLSLNNFIYNLKKNIINPILIKNSTIFFKDKNNEVVLISKIKKIDYKIDLINKKKILKINGNIFDSNYEFKYFIDYRNPNIQNLNLKLKKPNITFENILLDKINSAKTSQEGDLIIKFLNKKNILSYKIEDGEINFIDPNYNNSDFQLKGSIDFKPFYFDLNLDIKEINLENLEKIFYTIFINQNMGYENLSGNIKVNFNNIDNKVLKEGNLILKFDNSNLSTHKQIYKLKDYATLEIIDFDYLENNNEVLQIKLKINILNKEKFNRFLFNYKKNQIKSSNLYLIYQFNPKTGNSFISRVSTEGFKYNTDLYKFRNLQQLKNLLKDENVFK